MPIPQRFVEASKYSAPKVIDESPIMRSCKELSSFEIAYILAMLPDQFIDSLFAFVEILSYICTEGVFNTAFAVTVLATMSDN